MATLQKKTIVYIFIYIALFSSVYILSKMVIPPLDGISYVFLRSLIGMGFLFIFLACSGKLKGVKDLLHNDLRLIIKLSFFLTSSLVLAFIATTYTNPANQSIILNLTTIFIILLNFIFFKIIPKRIIIVSAFLSMFGIFLLMTPFEIKTNDTIIGDLFMIISTIFGAFYTIYAEKISKKYYSANISFTLAFFVVLMTFPFLILFKGYNDVLELAPMQIIILLILGIGVSGILYTMNALILSDPEITSNIMAIIITLVPIFGTILGVLIYGENMTSLNIVGAVIVILGVLIINLKRN